MQCEHFIYTERFLYFALSAFIVCWIDEVNKVVAVLVFCESEVAKCRARDEKEGFEGVSGEITYGHTQHTSMR